jgi:hypothetical protein
VRFVEVGAEVAPVPTEDRPRDGLDQRTLCFADQISAEEVRAAGSVFPRPPEPVVEEGGRRIRQEALDDPVQDDDVGVSPQAPGFLL